MTTANINPGMVYGAMPNQLFNTWSGVAGLYREAMEASARQLVLSSMAIIQEHALRAFMSASQACTEALAKNTMAVQQQSMMRFADAHQKALEVMGGAWMRAWNVNA